MSRLWPYILTELNTLFDAEFLHENPLREPFEGTRYGNPHDAGMAEKLKLVREPIIGKGSN